MVSGEHREKSLPDRNRAVKWTRFARRSTRAAVRILFAPYGTRGDVQPLIPLARALAARRHQIRFVVPANAVAWVRARGFECESNGVDVEAEVRAIASSGWGMRRRLRHVKAEIIPRVFDSVARAAAGVDLLVSSGVPFATSSVSEARGIPHVYTMLCPAVLPNTEGPPPLVKRQTLPRFINALLWRAMPVLGDLVLGPALNAGRAGLGLPPARRPTKSLMSTRMLVAADPDLAPLRVELRADSLRTDAWVFRDATALDARIASFIRSGPPPIYVGFGSMVATPSVDLARCAVGAARLTGHRLIVSGGWASLDRGLSESDAILPISEAPHDALFPLMAAAVHHGGAGTTTAAARAGIPQVIVPHVLDQFYWARRVEVLGLGPEALPVDAVSAGALAARVEAAAGEPAYAARARALASRMARRDGVPAAVQYLERLSPATVPASHQGGAP